MQTTLFPKKPVQIQSSVNLAHVGQQQASDEINSSERSWAVKSDSLQNQAQTDAHGKVSTCNPVILRVHKKIKR